MPIPRTERLASSLHQTFVFSLPALATAVFARYFFPSLQAVCWGLSCGLFTGKFIHSIGICSSTESLLYQWMQKSPTTLFFLKCLAIISLPFYPKISFYTAFALSFMFSFTAEYNENFKRLMKPISGT